MPTTTTTPPSPPPQQQSFLAVVPTTAAAVVNQIASYFTAPASPGDGAVGRVFVNALVARIPGG